MTTQYQVDVTGGWGYLGIVDAIYLPAQVGDADDDITLLFLLQYLSHFICLGDRIEILDAAIVGFGYQAGKFRTQAENANLQSLALDNGIRLYDICQFGTGEIIVGADDRKLCHLEDAHHVVDAEIELMVSDGSSIIFHLVHQSYFHISLEERIIR